MINTIIFDLGGVLIDWNPEYLFKKLIPDDNRRSYFLQNVCTHDWNVEHDAGRPIAEGTALKIAEFPDWETEIRAYYDRWTEMLGGVFDGTIALLRGLVDNPDYRVLALTNWSAETFPIAFARYDFLHWFDGIVVSGEEKTRKPFRDIYEILLSRYEVNPAQAVFIDDAIANVRGAEALGIHAIQFQSAEQLQQDLKSLGVIV
ncbi:MAG: HAD family phosphatase [Saprospiraceae bacterium]|nr:HAD family phosphatase [Saprospiraceae bacterium]